MIRTRFAEPADQDRLIAFVGEHWSATHIFTQRPDVFRWQHEQADGRLNMVLAEQVDDETEAMSSEVVAVLGFIPMGRFDAALGDRDITLAIWKVREADAPPGIGLRLLKFLQRELQPRLVAAIGISSMVRAIYEVLGYQVGVMRQAALFNPAHATALSVAQGFPPSVADPAATSSISAGAVNLVEVDDQTAGERLAGIEQIASSSTPSKSWDYLRARYLQHPWYGYEMRLVEVDGEPRAVIVWRQVAVGEATVLRLVDVVGPTDWFRRARPVLSQVLADADAEYIDLVHFGADTDALRAAGFVEASDHEGAVLPNYFSPFEQRNIEIGFAYKVFEGDDDGLRLYRADSDQDRPNLTSDLERLH